MKREQKKRTVEWIDASDPSVLSFFTSPFKHGLLHKAERASKNWRVNLEDGWMKPEKNTKFQMLGKARFLTAEDGSPYIVRNGPVRGKFLAFDAWQSNEELSTIYQKAFEEVEGAGGETGEQKVWIDGRYRTLLQYWKGDGHIVSVSYNCAFNCMRVEFENKGAVVCYLGVPQGTVDMLKDCVGKVRAGKGKHNHMLGVKFWDYIRIRGTKHGSRYPFWYVTDENGHTYESAVSKLKSAEIDGYMKKLQMSDIARLNKMSIEKRGVEQYIIDLDAIFSSPRYQKMYNSGEDIPGVDIDDLDNMVDEYNELMSVPNDKAYTKKEQAFVLKNLPVINKLKSLFKEEIHAKDKTLLTGVKEIETSAKRQRRKMAKYEEERKENQELIDLAKDLNTMSSMPKEDFKKLSRKYTKQLLGEYGEHLPGDKIYAFPDGNLVTENDRYKLQNSDILEGAKIASNKHKVRDWNTRSSDSYLPGWSDNTHTIQRKSTKSKNGQATDNSARSTKDSVNIEYRQMKNKIVDKKGEAAFNKKFGVTIRGKED